MKHKQLQGRSFLCLLLVLALALAGCRVRTRQTGQAGQSEERSSFQGAASTDQDLTSPESALSSLGRDPLSSFQSAASQEGNGPEADTGDGQGRTIENPQASRKEYDEKAQAEILPGTEHLLYEEGEGEGFYALSEEGLPPAGRLNDSAEESALLEVPAEEAEKKGTSEEGKEADSAFTYYTVLLAERAASLYECQRKNIYWETSQDHVTIYKDSLEHSLILQAGSYDVSARLLPENLKVDDGWITRKNPAMIVKAVGSDVLGSGVYSVQKAAALYDSLLSREGFGDIQAGKEGRVLLLSEELLLAPCLQAAAMLMIGKCAAPELYEDVDPAEALAHLYEEETGLSLTGVFMYDGGEGPWER